MNYVYKEKKLIDTYGDIIYGDGLKLKPKKSDLEIESLVLYDRSIINKVIDDRFKSGFKKILKLSMSDFEIDDETGENPVLTEIDRLEKLLLGKYKKFLSVAKLKRMLKELYTVEQNVKSKKEVYYNMNFYEETSHKSR